jgi:ribonuclease VapC
MTLDTSAVLVGRRGPDAGFDLSRKAAVDTVAFDDEQLRLARTAFLRYGKGRHAAGLNFGDCVSYGLAQWTGEPLLFKGADFTLTDVARVR